MTYVIPAVTLLERKLFLIVYIDLGWITTRSMSIARDSHTSVLLFDGTMLIISGSSSGYANLTESYSPGTGTWPSKVSISVPRWLHT
ncbi:unnamed protein product [Adineta ricciae]|uniref:Uncharacterized protein n=1 Tax=Adineta ricciae TaxID=249248 RepID=A0A815FNS7_ADIRI|nr:unnamed protein product [Adineta ricciae]